MRYRLNRRRLIFFNKKKILLFIFILIFIFFITTIYSQNKIIFQYFSKSVEDFSHNFNYQFTNIKIEGLINIDNNYIKSKVKKYIDTSIFLLPLGRISKEINENNWVKNIKLSTDYKNTLYINIEEYIPLGIYKFNKKYFFFDVDGKIIDEVRNLKNNYDDLIIFSGQSSNKEAAKLISILQNLNFQSTFKIKDVEYINKRRWNIRLINNLLLKLSENSPKKSLKNFIMIEKTLSETNMNNIKSVDLRNLNKTLLEY